LLASTNYAAIVRPLQIIVLAVAGLFLLRIMRVAMVEVRPPRDRRAERAAKKERKAQSKLEEVERPPVEVQSTKKARRRSNLALEFIDPVEHAGDVLDVVDAFTIGRSRDCDVVVDDIYLSGRHARFSHDDGDIFVEDLDSTNGTYINQRLISHRTRLERGDIVQVGGVLFEVVR
jgi:pSer/pThr/pTyr-binding forkhead associated (FHA) protein